jgi:hypothetical protein
LKAKVLITALLTGNTIIKADIIALRWIYQRAFQPIPATIPATGWLKFGKEFNRKKINTRKN